MNARLIIALVAVGLALTACGDDDGGSGGSELSDAQAAAAQSAIESAAEEGVTLDESCVNDVAAQLSEEDAELAAQDGDAELSPAGEALTIELIRCADQDELVDLLIAGFGGEEGFDEDCAREALNDLDVAELFTTSTGDEPPPEFIEALTPCFAGG